MRNFASLCVLGYKRAQMLIDCMNSIHQTIDYPCEIIVNDDTGTNLDILRQYVADGKISKLIISAGNNRGVGRSFQNALSISEGEYIVKIDTDLTFDHGWLSQAIKILENNPDVGAVGLFDYTNYDAKDERFYTLEDRDDCNIVSDFVSSAYVFRKRDFDAKHIENVPDDGMHQAFGKMAITKSDMAWNVGFGLDKSTYVMPDKDGKPIKTPTFDKPKLFKE